ncbi:type 1 glutamine amidotransferase family protein [Paenibacillus sp. MMS20-IR301]|uniref:type 1 glutamine amidotransferase family protein n=1 Tax=Paenibacillus sp. MMS20-IR301 TaxID=2895946 RepID=UPI0028F07F1F|nr:type 1 glutamine amidotransferase family protein [Paenibacillus sp. MMS20-IR301]WNS41544.1 type 1 glutamine amidotransferase family protein [Paenibacillus sp. MMS20-IR301]
MNNTVYLYVFDTMADWEIGYLTAELNSGRYYKQGQPSSKIVTVSLVTTPVTTMGGLTILPDIQLSECSITSTDALILPGGNTWTEAIHEPILELARRCMQENILVAAICGATIALAQAGLLNSRPHTSNDLGYLKMTCHKYTGEAYYSNQSAVTDGKLITASGIAPLEFTVHVLKALDVLDPDRLKAWYSLYKTQDAKYFYELMSPVQ